MIDISDVVPVLSLSQEDERICLGDNMREMFKIIEDMEETVWVGSDKKSSTDGVMVAGLSEVIVNVIQILDL